LANRAVFSATARPDASYSVIVVTWTEAFGATFDRGLFANIRRANGASSRFLAQLSKILLEHSAEKGVQLFTSRT